MSVPLAPAIIWYVFGLINSWSRLPIFGVPTIDGTSPTPMKNIEISFSRHISSSEFPKFANTLDEFQKRYGLCQLSVCHHVSSSPSEARFMAILYEWKFVSLDTQEEETMIVENCSLIWQAKSQGSYNIRVLIKRKDEDRILFSGQSEIKVLDYWIAAIGDSFASGEGNPDESIDPILRTQPVWLSRASSNNGIITTKMNESQLEILEKISVNRGKGPDLLMMTVGGNDAGYSEILNNLLSRDTSTMFNSMEMRLFYVAHQLERIGVKLKEEIRPTQVVVPHYFDLIRNELGVVDSNCSDLKNIPVESLRVAERNILRRVNRLITDKGRRHSWTVVDEVPKLFKTGGICSKTSLIRNTSDSLRLQGDTLGAFHPIEEAHRSIADLVWRKLNFRQLMLI